MSAILSQITGDLRKHQSSATLAFVRGIHRWSMNFPYRGLVRRRKMFPFDDVILSLYCVIIVLYCYVLCYCWVPCQLTYRQIANIRQTNFKTKIFFVVSFYRCLCAIKLSQVFSREWRCSWSSANKNGQVMYSSQGYVGKHQLMKYNPWI